MKEIAPEIGGRDLRRTARRRVLKSGTIAFNGRKSTLTCAVRDISETGARLRLEGLMAAPDTFELYVELDGIEVDCEVVWRKTPEVGVRFVSPIRKVTPHRVQIITPAKPRNEVPTLRRKPRSSETDEKA